MRYAIPLDFVVSKPYGDLIIAFIPQRITISVLSLVAILFGSLLWLRIADFDKLIQKEDFANFLHTMFHEMTHSIIADPLKDFDICINELEDNNQDLNNLDHILELRRIQNNLLAISDNASFLANDYERKNLNFDEYSLEQLIEAIQAKLSPEEKKRIQFPDTGGENILKTKIQCHLPSLGTAFKDLIKNALKYSDENVEFSVENYRAPKKVKISTPEVSERVKISIEDRGIGFPENKNGQIDQKHLTIPFVRGSNAQAQGFKGDGIGLAVANKSIVDLHGGILELVNNKNKEKGEDKVPGATVHIILSRKVPPREISAPEVSQRLWFALNSVPLITALIGTIVMFLITGAAMIAALQSEPETPPTPCPPDVSCVSLTNLAINGQNFPANEPIIVNTTENELNFERITFELDDNYANTLQSDFGEVIVFARVITDTGNFSSGLHSLDSNLTTSIFNANIPVQEEVIDFEIMLVIYSPTGGERIIETTEISIELGEQADNNSFPFTSITVNPD